MNLKGLKGEKMDEDIDNIKQYIKQYIKQHIIGTTNKNLFDYIKNYINEKGVEHIINECKEQFIENYRITDISCKDGEFYIKALIYPEIKHINLCSDKEKREE